jgi:hypothetical protein
MAIANKKKFNINIAATNNNWLNSGVPGGEKIRNRPENYNAHNQKQN